MEKIVEQGLLYDFYGELLTKHQQSVYAVSYTHLFLFYNRVINDAM